MRWIDIFVFGVGFVIVLATLLSAIRTFVLPRGARDPLVRFLFLTLRRVFLLSLRRVQSYERQDQILAFYAPIGLLMLLPFWLTTVLIGFMGMNWALGIRPWQEAFTVSGSSLLTLGFARGDALVHTALAFAEATIGLILVALLIAYLPTMYTAFSKREQVVTQLEVLAGTPPSPIELILRSYRIRGLQELKEFWKTWTDWFAEVEETHTSLAALVFFRSPRPSQSWVTAAGTVLDAAGLVLSTVEVPPDPLAALCLRAGYLALRRIADFFQVPYNPDPHFPADPISISREEYEAAYHQLREQGVPVRADMEQAWRDFAGWRVNYDAVLLALCRITVAPPALWSSDRLENVEAALGRPPQ